MEKTIDQDLSIINENEKLIANILHDVKSPLYSIKIGLASNLNNELNKDIFETTVSILNYIENFLTNYSFKKGKFQEKIESCDIKEMVYRKIENYKYIFLNKNIFTDIILNDSDYRINTIAIFVSSIIGNLISNIAFHAKQNERAKIELYKKQDSIFIDFQNKYENENHKFSLGLDFCRNLARCCKIDIKLTKTKNEIKVTLKIPNLSC